MLKRYHIFAFNICYISPGFPNKIFFDQSLFVRNVRLNAFFSETLQYHNIHIDYVNISPECMKVNKSR